MRTPNFRTAAVLLIFLGGLLSTVTGQSVLVVEHHQKARPVIFARGSWPFVEENGKPVAAEGERYALVKVPEFLPVFVSVRNLRVSTHHLELLSTGGSINNEFRFNADFESAYAIDNLLLVIELFLDDGTKSLFLRDIGRMERDHPRSLDLALPTSYPLGRFQYRVHLFSGGLEILHSQQPFALRESALDRLISRRTHGLPDGPPQPFVGPPPDYPEKFRKAKVTGHVRLKLRVRTTGAVVDASVIEASDPLFGEAALASMRQWRFLPRIKDGHPVDTVVEIPLQFTPPEPPAKS